MAAFLRNRKVNYRKICGE